MASHDVSLLTGYHDITKSSYERKIMAHQLAATSPSARGRGSRPMPSRWGHAPSAPMPLLQPEPWYAMTRPRRNRGLDAGESNRRGPPLIVVRLWMSRWLFVRWAQRDFIVRYRQSELGLAWALVQPASLLLVYGLVFTKVLHIQTPLVSYLDIVYPALAPWTFISKYSQRGA